MTGMCFLVTERMWHLVISIELEGHLPVLFPFFKLLQVFLEDAGVRLGEDLPVEDVVVGEQSHHGHLPSLRLHD